MLNTMLVFLLALALPGPDMLMVSQTSLRYGQRAGILTGVGIALGCLFYASLALMGLNSLFTAAGWMGDAIRLIGGAYLIYLAYQVLRSARQPLDLPHLDVQRVTTAADLSHETQRIAGRDDWRYLRLGFVTNLTNPKAVAFFGSIFALFLTGDTTWAEKTALLTIVFGMASLWFTFVAILLSRPGVRTIYIKAKTPVDYVAALALGGFGIKMVAQALSRN